MTIQRTVPNIETMAFIQFHKIIHFYSYLHGFSPLKQSRENYGYYNSKFRLGFILSCFYSKDRAMICQQ